MATKIRYNVHTSNKYSVFDSEVSEEDIGIKNKIKNKNAKDLIKPKNNDERKTKSNNEIKNSNEIKNVVPTPKIAEEKKFINTLNDRNKHIIPSLNDVMNERAYRTYRENMLNKKNEKKKNAKTVTGNNNTATPSNTGGGNTSYYKGSRNYEYKGSSDRRLYNSSYRHDKYDYRERTLDYDNMSPRYEKLRRDTYDYRSRSGYYDGVRKTRKQESITIDFDMYKRQQEKKMNSNNKNVDSVDSKKKEVSGEKNERTNSNIRCGETGDNHKPEHPKKKVLNMYQFLSEERKRTDRLPGFYRNYRSYRRETGVGEDGHRSFNSKSKITIDESILKNRDPPNIYDTRAFPSLTTSK